MLSQYNKMQSWFRYCIISFKWFRVVGFVAAANSHVDFIWSHVKSAQLIWKFSIFNRMPNHFVNLSRHDFRPNRQFAHCEYNSLTCSIFIDHLILTLALSFINLSNLRLYHIIRIRDAESLSSWDCMHREFVLHMTWANVCGWSKSRYIFASFSCGPWIFQLFGL